ncbi:energy-coupling factor transporter transmembrane component T family protein [Pseudokineococcus sp. 1T1Z-3]|uniref:energy-coupling factor transporter transmembrane component T family protein n=1 Tax=Pseudokineococcus sp. 1T1Z-3 TaxID=3132745 RepID=UPI00403F2314
MGGLVGSVRATPLTRANPLALLAGALVIAVALLATVDVVSAATALLLEIPLLPLAGLGPRALAVRMLPVLLASVPAGLVTTVIGRDAGAVLLDLGPLSVTEGSLDLGVATTLRILAVGVPGVLLLVSADPTDLGDALAQRLRLPPRFVLGGLAGLRLAGLLVLEWRTLSLARRARGLGDVRGPLAGTRVAAGQAFALLVLALRRATRLAVAMEARGFGAPGAPRTWARRSTFAARDVGVVAGCALVAAAATGAAVWAGTWSLVVG